MWPNDTITERVVELFKNKKEVSLQKDILPTIENVNMYSPVNTVTTDTMNFAITKAIEIVRENEIYYTAQPVFAVGGYGVVYVKDVTYKIMH